MNKEQMIDMLDDLYRNVQESAHSHTESWTSGQMTMLYSVADGLDLSAEFDAVIESVDNE